MQEFKTPSKYIQGEMLLSKLSEYALELGVKPFIIWDSFVSTLVGRVVSDNLPAESLYVAFDAELNIQNIDVVAKDFIANDCDIVIAIGGGKVIDAGKVVADKVDAQLIVCPTNAASDAPTSSLAVLYENERIKYYSLKRNPNMIIVDLHVIANSPAYMLRAGMADALATYIEARACIDVENNLTTPLLLAKASYEQILNNGKKALLANSKKEVTSEFAHVIEASIYQSGVAFENTSLACAHAINNYLSVCFDTTAMHGEKVAYGLLVQLVMENNLAEFEKLYAFFQDIGLPINLRQLGASNNSPRNLKKLAQQVAQEESPLHNMQIKYNVHDVYEALYIVENMNR